jgi:hypothetical protein
MRSAEPTRVRKRSLHAQLVASSDDNLLAADGEIFRGHADFTVEKHPQRLLVYVPE